MFIRKNKLKRLIENFLKEEEEIEISDELRKDVEKMIPDIAAELKTSKGKKFLADKEIYIEFSTESVISPGVSKLYIKSGSGQVYFVFDAVAGHKKYFGKDPLKTMAIKSYSEEEAKATKTSNSAVAGGPTPEGVYTLGKLQTQGQDGNTSTLFNRAMVALNIRPVGVKAAFGQKNKVSKIAWGNFRYSLIPEDDAELFARDKMYIHGGSEAGSGGCIDLTDEMDNFSLAIESWRAKNPGEEISVIVDYPPLGQSVDYDSDEYKYTSSSTTVDNVDDYN